MKLTQIIRKIILEELNEKYGEYLTSTPSAASDPSGVASIHSDLAASAKYALEVEKKKKQFKKKKKKKLTDFFEIEDIETKTI